MELSAVILAGGASRRMGRNKARLRLGGKTLLELAVEKARALGLHEVFISGRSGENYATLGCPVLFDRARDCGPLGGIARGLEDCATPLLLVLPVDLPYLTTDFLNKLIRRSDTRTGVVPKLRGEWEPLVAIYPKRVHALAGAALAQRHFAVQDFTAACRRRRAVKVLRVADADARCFINWNTPQDVARGADA